MKKIIEKTLLICMIAAIIVLVLLLAFYMLLDGLGVDMQLVKVIISSLIVVLFVCWGLLMIL